MTADTNKTDVMEKLVSLCKRRGFIFQGSEIYGGLAGTWDFGPYGVALKNNIKNLWWKQFVTDREDMYGIDADILMNSEVWVATQHATTFADPLTTDLKTGKKYRADHLLEEAGVDVKGMTIARMTECIKEKGIKSPEDNPLSDVEPFNMMLKTQIGSDVNNPTVSYLRPETAQGMFVNFKNVMDTLHPKLPFGLAQIGKAFRNEIAPRDFIFRLRELEQMEIEYFIRPDVWEETFEHFRSEIWKWIRAIGIDESHVHELEVPDEDRAHYSKRTIDFEFDYPFGRKELYGLAYRTDFDLGNHSRQSGVDLSYYDEEAKERFLPHCIEPSFGLDRTILAVLSDAYMEDEMGGEARTYLKLSPSVAPVKAAVFPLLKNKPELVAKAREVYAALKKEFGAVEFDDNGNIGKRYRRQDEIGTPFCITIDFDTLEKDAGVTVRDRDSGKQERVALGKLEGYLKRKLGE